MHVAPRPALPTSVPEPAPAEPPRQPVVLPGASIREHPLVRAAADMFSARVIDAREPMQNDSPA